jgi:hypothetical protein
MTPVAQIPSRRLPQLRLDFESGRRRPAVDFTRTKPRQRSQCADGNRLTLGQSLDSVWEGLVAVGAADCPMCGTRMERAGEDAGGSCGGCGTTLA